MQSLQIGRTFLAALVLTASAVGAEDFSTFSIASKGATPGCQGGLVVDDGSYETAYGLGGGTPGAATMVQKLDFGTTETLDQVCICFARDQENPGSDDFAFEIVLYDDDGAGGSPGSFLGSVAATATNVPIFPLFTHYGVDLVPSGIQLPGGDVYVGARWPGGQSHFLCGDRSAGTQQQDLYLSGNQGGAWSSMDQVFPANAPKALGIRADPTNTPSQCVASATTLCLQDNRFAVEATWYTNDGSSGSAFGVELTPDTGYFWFFNPNNVEMVIKLHNACTFNERFWVFAGGLTNVRVDITVTDTQTGIVSEYLNPQNTAFQPIQDTDAFFCP